jgi:Cu/Ag efflux protein CusF
MKSILRLLLVPVVTLVFAGTSLAQGTGSTGGTGTTKSPTATKPAEKKAVKPKTIKATGELTSADAKAGMAKVKTKDKELSLSTEAQDVKDSLAKVKVGDTVKVAYVEKDGKLTLSSVAKTKPPTVKPTQTKADTKPATK